MQLELISHHLCPYVQRAIITLSEKNVAFTRTDIDLANKPDWFLAISPLGKTPVLRIDGREVIFESAVICEFLEETHGPRLHPADPIDRARHRSWIEFASATLNDIAGLYGAPDQTAFDTKRDALRKKADQIEAVLGDGPFFSGSEFSLVDAAFGPVFRYFDTFETFVDLGVFDDRPNAIAWRQSLAARPSVIAAVDTGYPARLANFLAARNTYISGLIGVAH
jgi:glutathione S-transferase